MVRKTTTPTSTERNRTRIYVGTCGWHEQAMGRVPNCNRFRLLLLLSSLLAALLPVRVDGQEPSLLGQTTHVAETRSWYLGHDGNYSWISEHEVLIFRNVPAPPFRITHDPDGTIAVAGGVPYGGEIMRYDLKRGAATPISGLTDRFAREQGWLRSVHLSPDGKRLFWRSNRAAHVTDLQTGTQHDAPVWLEEGIWMDDSRHMVGFTTGRPYRIGTAMLYDMVGNEAPISLQYDTRSADRAVFLSPQIRVTSDRTLLSTSWYLISTACPNYITRTRVGGAQDQYDAFPIAIPPHDRLAELQFSPEAKRIAWLDKPETGQETSTTSVSNIWSLWVSNLDGSRKQEISRLEVEDGVEAPRLLKWLPSGNRLSFVFKGALWTIPVPRPAGTVGTSAR